MPGVLDSYKEEAAKVSHILYCHQKISRLGSAPQKSKYPMIQSKSSVEGLVGPCDDADGILKERKRRAVEEEVDLALGRRGRNKENR